MVPHVRLTLDVPVASWNPTRDMHFVESKRSWTPGQNLKRGGPLSDSHINSSWASWLCLVPKLQEGDSSFLFAPWADCALICCASGKCNLYAVVCYPTCCLRFPPHLFVGFLVLSAYVSCGLRRRIGFLYQIQSISVITSVYQTSWLGIRV